MLTDYLEIKELVEITNKNKESFVVIFINGNKEYTQANSGYLEEKEAEQIDNGFREVSSYYNCYNNSSTFVGDIVLNNLPFNKDKIKLLYSTAQIGVDVNRRSFIPNLAQIHHIYNLTCDSYNLALLQNKAHYYGIAKNHVKVPTTLIFNGQNHEVFEALTNIKYILKPNLECSARGVKVIHFNNSSKEEIIKLYQEFNQPILIQEFKEGIEVEVPVIIKNKISLALPPIKIVKRGTYLNQDEVDCEKYSFEILSDLFNIDFIQKSAEIVMDALQSEGLCRVDFIIDENGTPWLFDIAAIPLISNHSSCYTSFKHLFPNDEYALYKALIGAKLMDLI
jgi:D-alanine-D-alanine ligase